MLHESSQKLSFVCTKRFVFQWLVNWKFKILVCGMASSDRRGKLKIETCLKSDRLEIVVHEAEGLRNDFDESEPRIIWANQNSLK